MRPRARHAPPPKLALALVVIALLSGCIAPPPLPATPGGDGPPLGFLGSTDTRAFRVSFEEVPEEGLRAYVEPFRGRRAVAVDEPERVLGEIAIVDKGGAVLAARALNLTTRDFAWQRGPQERDVLAALVTIPYASVARSREPPGSLMVVRVTLQVPGTDFAYAEETPWALPASLAWRPSDDVALVVHGLRHGCATFRWTACVEAGWRLDVAVLNAGPGEVTLSEAQWTARAASGIPLRARGSAPALVALAPGEEARVNVTFRSEGGEDPPASIILSLGPEGEVRAPVVGAPALNAPPLARFDVEPEAPLAGETVRFVDRSRDPDGRIVEREWRLSCAGCLPERGEGFTRVFPAGGTYVVNLTIADEDGAVAHAQRAIQVAYADGASRVRRLEVSAERVNLDADAPKEVALDVRARGEADGDYHAFRGTLLVRIEERAGSSANETYLEVANWTREVDPRAFSSQWPPSYRFEIGNESFVDGRTYRITATVTLGPGGLRFSDSAILWYLV